MTNVELKINIKPMLRYIHVLTLVQLNGNMSAICEMSRNNIRQVISKEKIAQKTINLKRPMSGSKKRPTCTVPAEHSQARQAADDNTKRIRTIPVGVFKCCGSQCRATPHGSGVWPLRCL